MSAEYMSLDIMLCKIVKPEKANQAYDVRSHPKLQRLQPTGFLCVQQRRIGRSCLNKKWHDRYAMAVGESVENDNHVPLDEMAIIFPDEVHEKLLRFVKVDKGEEQFQWLNQDDLACKFDFLFISW